MTDAHPGDARLRRASVAVGLRALAVIASSLAILLMGMPLQRAAAAPAEQQGQRIITYQVAGAGNSTEIGAFSERVGEILGNPRGWALGGSILFQEVDSGGDFVLWLAAPERLPGFSAGCSALWSCRVGENVIINEMRWIGGTDDWNASGASLADYQAMVLNHEVGHRLGFDHSYCGAAGSPAPVMQQQSKGLQGCEPNPWPTADERAEAGLRNALPVLPLSATCTAQQSGGPVPSLGTPESAVGLLDTGTGAGTGNLTPCRVKPGTAAGFFVGGATGGREPVQRIRVEHLALDSPGSIRLWTSAGDSARVDGSQLPIERSLRVGSDGMVFAEVESRFGWAELRVSGLGQSGSAGAGGALRGVGASGPRLGALGASQLSLVPGPAGRSGAASKADGPLGACQWSGIAVRAAADRAQVLPAGTAGFILAAPLRTTGGPGGDGPAWRYVLLPKPC